MTKVNFYDSIDDSMLKFAVIIAKHNGKWVFCKHRERSTWEVPGGHREQEKLYYRKKAAPFNRNRKIESIFSKSSYMR